MQPANIVFITARRIGNCYGRIEAVLYLSGIAAQVDNGPMSAYLTTVWPTSLPA